MPPLIRRRIVILDTLTEVSHRRFAELVDPGFDLVVASSADHEHLEQLIAEADYAISGQTAVPDTLFRAAKRLRLLHKWGVGVDNIDLAAARSLGIPVARVTGGNATPVAEYTIGLMIAALRHLAWGHTELKKGRWGTRHLPYDSMMLHGRIVGLVGFGAIGRRVAALLQAFGCTVLYTRPSGPDASANAVATFMPLDQLLAESDVVSLHCPLSADTAGMINREALTRMKRHAVLINVARGGVVSDADLHWALKERVIRGAAVDVFDIEPLPPDSPLLALDNLVMTPHLAGIAADNFAPTVIRMLDNIARIERGEAIPEHERVVP